MKAHVVKDGIVVNTIEVSSLDFMPGLVAADAGGIGWVFDGVKFIDPNAKSQSKITATKEQAIRNQRGKLLAETDWIVIMHTEKGTNIPAAWEIYRQSLRDITAQDGFPHNVTWPVKPE